MRTLAECTMVYSPKNGKSRDPVAGVSARVTSAAIFTCESLGGNAERQLIRLWSMNMLNAW